MDNSSQNNFQFNYYLVAYVDVLNQKNILQNIDHLPENDDEKALFVEALKNSFGVVNAFRQSFHNFFKGYENRPTPNVINELSSEQRQAIIRSTEPGIQKQLFSDSIVIFTSLADNSKHLPIATTCSIIEGLASVFLSCLASKVAIRGGMEIGIASESFFNAEIYGPALYQAYHLESQVAMYPRIVIGTQLYKYLILNSEIDKDDPESLIVKKIAHRCINLITLDTDGMAIIDYLSIHFKNMFIKNDELKKLIYDQAIQAYEFVNTQWAFFRNKGDQKLASRYFNLKVYFDQRIKPFLE